MFDAVDPTGMLIPSEDEARTIECPGCTTAFMPKRLNQSYCSRACQKNGSRATVVSKTENAHGGTMSAPNG